MGRPKLLDRAIREISSIIGSEERVTVARQEILAEVEQLSRVRMLRTEGWWITATVVEHERPKHFFIHLVASEFSFLVTETDVPLTDSS